MDKEKEKKAQSPLEALVIVSSVLAIAAYLLHNPLFFHIAGIVCAVLVLFVVVTFAATTPKGLGFINMGLYIFGALFLLVGWLIARNIWDGLLLGFSILGIATSIVYAIFNHFSSKVHEDYEAMKAVESLNENMTEGPIPEGYDYIDDLDNCEDWETIRCDENATTEERVKAMDLAFNRACGAIGDLDENLFPFEKVLDTVAELEKYQSSGLWKRDFESDEAGELPPDAARGVLSEDGLYNVLRDYDRIMARLKKITENR